MSRGLWALVLVACNDGPTNGSDKPGDDDDSPADTDVTDTGTPADTDTTQRDGCYADWAGDTGDDGVVDGTGIDVYDPVRTDLLLDAERFYSFLDQYAYHYTYDEDGRETRFEYDDGNDGTPDTVLTYTYDNGLLVGYTRDEDGDGVQEEVWTYTWNEDGRLDTAAEDTDDDGDPDYGFAYTYDEDGKRLTATEDLDGDGVNDIWYTYTYDEAGRISLFQGDTGNDGSVDYVSTYTYTDPVLLVGSNVRDEGNDGVLDYTEQFAYDADGNRLFSEQDEGADGVVNTRVNATYTEDDQLLVFDYESYDDPGDGDSVFVVHEEYTYDTSSREIEHTQDGLFTSGGQEITLSGRDTWTFGGTCP